MIYYFYITTDKTKEKDKPKGTGIADIKIPELETTKKGINDLIPLFKNLQSEATKVTLKKLGNELSVSNVGLNKTASFLRDVNSEVEAIQVRADRGFITNQQADLEKLEVLKKALQNALQQGLGTGVIDQISQQITDLGVTAKPQFDNIFDYLGNKIASIPSIAEKLGKDLKSLGPEISKAIEGAAAAIQQVFSTIGSYFTLQEQNLDAFEEKEKQRIQNSLLGEQQKAEALDKLNEDVLKKRKILARKHFSANDFSLESQPAAIPRSGDRQRYWQGTYQPHRIWLPTPLIHHPKTLRSWLRSDRSPLGQS